MNTFSKLASTFAAGAMVVSSATPAFARGHDRDGVDAGDVIAGALVIGGIAAVAAAADNDRDSRYDYRDGPRPDDRGYEDRGYGDRGYGNRGYGDRHRDRGYGDRDRGYGDRGSARRAVEQCVSSAERDASRFSYGRADVTDIRSLRETRWGYEVRGRIAVNAQGRGWRRGDANYGRGWNSDYRGWNAGLRGYDSGSFVCRVNRGQVADIDYFGIRGL